MYKPRKRIDVGTWGIMGIGMGYCVAAAVVTGQQVIAVEGDSAFGFSGMEHDLSRTRPVRRDHEQESARTVVTRKTRRAGPIPRRSCSSRTRATRS